jgi:hypothetical protein
MNKPVVYLLHWPRAGPLGRHYLGTAASEGAIDVEQLTHGRGARPGPPGATIADVWEAETEQAAHALYRRLRRQGGRRRLCSVCSPGNSRGSGRGNYVRRKS